MLGFDHRSLSRPTQSHSLNALHAQCTTRLLVAGELPPRTSKNRTLGAHHFCVGFLQKITLSAGRLSRAFAAHSDSDRTIQVPSNTQSLSRIPKTKAGSFEEAYTLIPPSLSKVY